MKDTERKYLKSIVSKGQTRYFINQHKGGSLWVKPKITLNIVRIEATNDMIQVMTSMFGKEQETSANNYPVWNFEYNQMEQIIIKLQNKIGLTD